MGFGFVSAAPCTDSDSGINGFIKGYAEDIDHISDINHDVCFKNNQAENEYNINYLFEIYCDGDELKTTIFYCEEGCSDAACQGGEIQCQERWLCNGENSIAYLNSNCLFSNYGECDNGCEDNQCIQEGLNYSTEITSSKIQDFKRIVLNDETFVIETTIKNHLNKSINNVSVSINDMKGWESDYDINLDIYETKNYNFTFEALMIHSNYNPHEFFIEVENNFGSNSNNTQKMIVFDKNTLTNLTEGESKKVIVGEEEYNLSIMFIDSSSVRLNINGEQNTFSNKRSKELSNQGYLGIFVIYSPSIAGDVGYITFAIAPPGKNATCEDTDNGKIYGDRGETCFGADCKYDSCNRYNLTEYYCENDEIKSEIHECEDLCEAGMCLTQCATCGVGDRGCIDEDTYEICVDDGGCSFYEQFDCEAGQICEDGECTTPLPDNACDTTGLRENRKYCSSELVWINQKQTNNLCDEDFECRSNNCEIRCQGSSPPPTPTEIYWIIGILVAVLIIGIIVSLILAKKK